MGKTTFVHVLTSEERPESVPKVYKPVKIPPDQCVDGCCVTIIDSWQKSEDQIEESLEEEISKIDIVLLVFDVSNKNSITRICEFWIKNIEKICRVPIIIVGNKIDKKDEFYCIEDVVEGIVKTGKEFEAVFECSCLTLEGIAEIFVALQKVVLYPNDVLVDLSTGELQKDFVRVLRMIFRRIDKDKDFWVSPEELRQVQEEIFQGEITIEDANQIIALVYEKNGKIKENGLDFEGFCTMQLMLIEKSQTDICWKTLFHFGFDRKLSLELEDLQEGFRFLSRSTTGFLISVFDQYSKEGVLDEKTVFQIFEPCPETPGKRKLDRIWSEFKEKVEIQEKLVKLSAWLAYWTAFAWQDPKVCCKFLCYIGCDVDISEIVTDKNEDTLKIVYLAGINAVGKTFVLDSVLKRHSADYIPTNSLKSSCVVLKENLVPWLNQYVLIYEIPLIEVEDLLKSVKNSEFFVVVTNEKPESQEFIHKLALSSKVNLRVLNNSNHTLQVSQIFDLLHNLSNPQPDLHQPKKKSYFLIFLFTILTSVLLHLIFK